MSYKDKLESCLVSLDVGDQNALLIVLSKDGTICRRGNGNPHKQMELLKGVSTQEHYEAFMMTVSEDLFMFSGFFEQNPIIGTVCKVMIVFSGPHGEEAGFKVLYGADSQGPPHEITEMLINAVKLTDQWYEEERQKLLSATSVAPSAASPSISRAQEESRHQTPAQPRIKPLVGTESKNVTPENKAWWEFWK